MKITAIESNRQWLDGGSMFGNAPRAVWERWSDVDNQGRIPLACRCLLVDDGKNKVLFETGIGSFFEPKMAERFGVQDVGTHKLRDNLKSLGVDPNEINFVVLSHLHFDHAGGLLPTFAEMEQGEDQLLFPNAKYVVGKEAWQRALHPHFRDRASFVPLLNKKLEESGRLHILNNLERDPELPPWLSFYSSSGHTPGQIHAIIKGDKISVVFAGDLVPGVPWVHLPITMGYDRFPEKLIEEKQALYEKMSGTNWQIFFTHDPKIAMATLEKDEKGKFHTRQELLEVTGLEI
ncbi:MAG: MBL fold metallo-hydrolase [Bdellovibrionales bacterium]|nr:MBL fold metallo-hydrolase [Bdellovibrionales bacterium]